MTNIYMLCNCNDFVKKISNLFGGSKYDGKYLRSLVRLELGNLIMKQTLTHTLIPTFDIERLQPIIFTTTDVRYTISLPN